jgi:RNA polymerase primary sigma factor
MPAQKPKKPAQAAAKAKPVAKPAVAKKAAAPVAKAKTAQPMTAKAPAKKPAPVVSKAKVAAKPAAKAAPSKVKATATPATPAKPVKKAASVPAKKSEVIEKKTTAKAKETVAEVEVKKPAKAAKAAAAPAAADKKPAAKKAVTGAKRGPKKKGSIAEPSMDDDLDIEADLQGEPVADNVSETGEKVKPLRMKISKAKERALMKEFGLDETVLTEAEMKQRRDRLKALIKLGKTRGYLTNGEISDHLPDKLVDAETLEVVIATLNDLGVAVYEQTPDAESLIITDNAPTGSTRRRSRRSRRSRFVHRGQRIWPHHRPRAHVHARDGHCGTADPRRRDRDCQAHRRRLDGHDGRDQRVTCHHRRNPAHGQRNP